MPAKHFFLKPFYVLLLSVFFVLHGFSDNFFLIPIKDALVLLFIYLVSTIALIVLCSLYFKNIGKAALFTFLIMAINFFFGYLHDSVKFFFPNSFFPGSFVVKYSVIVSIALLTFIVVALALKRKNPVPQKLTIYLNLLFSVFILIEIAVLTKKSIIY